MVRNSYNEREVADCIFVNGTHAVVDKVATEQKSEKENLGVVIFVFIKGSNSLRVNQEHSHFLFFVICAKIS